jgi:hypothetical protein
LGPFHAAVEAGILPHDAPVERERFPAPAFGGPRGFRGGLRGRFAGGFGRPFGHPL